MIVSIAKCDPVLTDKVHSGVQGGKRSPPMGGKPVYYVASIERRTVDSFDPYHVWKKLRGVPVERGVSGVGDYKNVIGPVIVSCDCNF